MRIFPWLFQGGAVSNRSFLDFLSQLEERLKVIRALWEEDPASDACLQECDGVEASLLKNIESSLLEGANALHDATMIFFRDFTPVLTTPNPSHIEPSSAQGGDGELPVVSLGDREISADILRLLPSEVVNRLRVVPIAKIGTLVKVVVPYGIDTEEIGSELKEYFGSSFEMQSVDSQNLDVLIRRYYSESIGPHTAHEIETLLDETIGDDDGMRNDVRNLASTSHQDP